MRRSIIYEAGAAIFAIVGAFLLVFVFFPLLNPGAAAVRGINASLRDSLVLSVVSILLLILAWKLNKKAQQLKIDDK